MWGWGALGMLRLTLHIVMWPPSDLNHQLCQRVAVQLCIRILWPIRPWCGMMQPTIRFSLDQSLILLLSLSRFSLSSFYFDNGLFLFMHWSVYRSLSQASCEIQWKCDDSFDGILPFSCQFCPAEAGSDKLNCYRCKFRILKIMTDWLVLMGLSGLSVIRIY